jgi:hypothetical protein
MFVTPPFQQNFLQHGVHCGVFAVPAPPAIQYVVGDGTLVNSNRLVTSIKKIKGNLEPRGYFGDIALIWGNPREEQYAERLGILELHIRQLMRLYLSNPDDTAVLKTIFHCIQFWGGSEGRGPYVKRKKRRNYPGQPFEGNFNILAYREFIGAIKSQDMALGARIAAFKRASEGIFGWGVSFATKHLKLWAEAIRTEEFPIFDSFMAQGCYGYELAHWDLYSNFVSEIAAHSQQLNLTRTQFERCLFNWFSTTQGQEWLRLRNH